MYPFTIYIASYEQIDLLLIYIRTRKDYLESRNFEILDFLYL